MKGVDAVAVGVECRCYNVLERFEHAGCGFGGGTCNG